MAFYFPHCQTDPIFSTISECVAGTLGTAVALEIQAGNQTLIGTSFPFKAETLLRPRALPSGPRESGF